MQILHIISMSQGGVSTFVKNIIKNSSSSYKYTVLSFTEFDEEYMKLSEVRGCRIVVMPRPKVVGYKIFFTFLNSFFKQNQFDFIHSHMTGIYPIVFKCLARRHQDLTFGIHSHQTQYVPKIKEEMNIIDKVLDKLNPKINNQIADVRIACGLMAAEYDFGSYDGVEVLYNSVDFNKFSKYFGLKSDSSVLRMAHIGRHTSQKNLGFIIELAKYIDKSTDIKFEIRMFGDGEETQTFSNDINNSNLSDVIILEGNVSNLEDYLRDVDVLILPSHWEGLPTVAIESQASGTPMLISNTVTQEVDLGFNLVEYLPINRTEKTYDLWLEKALNHKFMNKTQRITKSQVYNKMYNMGFIDTVMVKQYEKILNSINENNVSS